MKAMALRFPKRLTSWLLAILVGIGLVSGASGAEPRSVLTVRGSCASEELRFKAVEFPQLLRASTPTSALELNFALNIGASDFIAAGDVRWIFREAKPPTTDAPDLDVLFYSCSSGEWTGDIYRIPDAPTRFNGISTFGMNPYGGRYEPSEVVFRAPAGARYVAVVTPRQGAVTLSLRGGRAATFASPGSFDVGFVRAGNGVLLGIEPRDGPPAVWEVSVAAAPLVLTQPAASRQYARPGQLVTIRYGLSGDARVDVAVRRRGQVVRELATGTNMTAGSHSVLWDGLNSQGRPVPDGLYSIDVAAGDVFGANASGTASTAIDSSPPRIIFESPKTISPQRGIVFRIVDALAGYRNGFVKVDGRATGFRITKAGTSRFVLTAPEGWTGGSHTVTVTAFDSIGNRGQASRLFRVK
jgi:hypothetical protein